MSEMGRRRTFPPMPTKEQRPTRAGVVWAMLLSMIFGGFGGAAVQRSMTPAPAIPVLTGPTETMAVAGREKPTPAPETSTADEPKGFEIHRDTGSTSLFVVPVRGTVGRDTVPFAIDTGAEVTILREQDVAAMGAVPTDLHDREVVVIGSVMPMKGATIPDLKVAGVDLGETEVLIGPNTLPFSLLGQKEISRLGMIEFDGDVMRVRPSRNEESLD
jgi:predicted aspartyl protease